MVRSAGRVGAVVQIDLIDGWIVKHQIWGDVRISPWTDEDCKAATNHITPVQDAFIKKAVQELGRFGNVIWQDGNEVGVTSWYDPRWSLQVLELVRRYEQEVGLGVVHLIGTNSGSLEAESGAFDYTITHSKSGISGPYLGKFRMNNEHNPPFTPSQEKQLFCAAYVAGQSWGYWRGGQSQEDMDATLTGIRDAVERSCAGTGTGDCP